MKTAVIRTFVARVAAGCALLLAGFLAYMYVESRATAEARLATTLNRQSPPVGRTNARHARV